MIDGTWYLDDGYHGTTNTSTSTITITSSTSILSTDQFDPGPERLLSAPPQSRVYIQPSSNNVQSKVG